MSSDLNPGIAVMMYTVLAQARADLEGTLARLAAAGYTGVETYGLVEEFGPARVRAAISAAGLTLTSAHAPFPAGSRAEAILDENEELGARVLVWSMEREEFDSPAAISRGVERVNEAAERAASRGMAIAYHNHFAEFSQFHGGRQAYDLLLEQLDDRVLVELDAYWALMGGADPAEVLTRLGERVRFLHVKTEPPNPPDRIMLGPDISDRQAEVLALTKVELPIVEAVVHEGDIFPVLERNAAFFRKEVAA
jgi:sugar phosphate isomerase/epimerase